MDLFDPQILLLIVGTIAAGWCLIRWPEAGLVVGVVLLYLNLPALAAKLHGVPAPIAAAAGLVIVPAIAHRFLGRNQRFVIDLPLLLMFAFLATTILSSFLARDEEQAMNWLGKYVFEGLLLYLLMINLIRSAATLRRVTWALLFAGTLLASMTVYQELTHNYRNEFGGLAQRMLERESSSETAWEGLAPRSRPKIRVAHRAQGPIDDPNRYAQMLIVLVPLAWVRIRRESKSLKRWLAAGCGVAMLGAILLTYSRGAFLTILVMSGLITVLRGVRVAHLLAALIVFVTGAAILAPGYAGRMLSLRGVQGLLSESADHDPDSVQRGRATEMLAAWNVFRDYPILGVGPGQFATVYSIAYMSEAYSLRRITEPRRAHSLYLELAAETGAIGLGIFLAIIVVILRRLLQLWRWNRITDPEGADYSLAFVLAIAGYLTTAFFLQLSYQRYYWFLLALGSATFHVVKAGGFRVLPVLQTVAGTGRDVGSGVPTSLR